MAAHRDAEPEGARAGDPLRAGIPAAARAHLGGELRAFYGAVLAEPPPPRLLDLVARLDGTFAERDATAAAFRKALVGALPGLRAFAVSLTLNAVGADDLVQETVLRAWASQHRFAPGSNFTAWLCTILRNQFYSELRKRRREVEDADGVLAAGLTAPAEQEHAADLGVVRVRLATLPAPQREALVLVGAQGLTYEAAAALIGCQVGTVKSRVSRARSTLAATLA